MNSLADGDGVVTDVKVTYRWEISNFCTTCPKIKRVLESPILVHHQSNSKFQMIVYPKGNTEVSKEHVSVFLSLIGKNGVDISCSISILSNANIGYYTLDFRKKLDPEHLTSWGSSEFAEQTEIMNQRTKFLSDNKLRFLIEITVHKVFDNRDNDLIVKKRPRLDIDATPSNSYNFEQFFAVELFSDVTFVTIDNRQIHAHKSILAGKSDVFLELFQNETEKSIIDIKDVDFKVLEEMLRYIYTNKVNDLSKIARDLLVCAGKYGLADLKKLCETYLCDNISTSTALDLVAYAESYKLTKLRKRTVNYIVTNMKEVVNTPNFESMAIRHPTICVEIIRRSANQK